MRVIRKTTQTEQTNKQRKKETNKQTKTKTNQQTKPNNKQNTNQPTTKKPTNRPTHPPTNQPTNKPTNKPTNQPSNQASNQATKQPSKQTSKQATTNLVTRTKLCHLDSSLGVAFTHESPRRPVSLFTKALVRSRAMKPMPVLRILMIKRTKTSDMEILECLQRAKHIGWYSFRGVPDHPWDWHVTPMY